MGLDEDGEYGPIVMNPDSRFMEWMKNTFEENPKRVSGVGEAMAAVALWVREEGQACRYVGIVGEARG